MQHRDSRIDFFLIARVFHSDKGSAATVAPNGNTYLSSHNSNHMKLSLLFATPLILTLLFTHSAATAQSKDSSAGTVIVDFIVHPDSTISDIRVVSGPKKGGLREEAIHVVTASGKWIPGVTNGAVASAHHREPIKFVLMK